MVTGAARGLGRIECLALARAGADVVALDICRDLPELRYRLSTPADLDETVGAVRALGRRCLGVVGDVRRADEVRRAVDQALAEFGRIDILVNNAGVISTGPSWELGEAEWDVVLDTLLKGCWLCSKHVAPVMIERRAGAIVNVASVVGLRGWPNMVHYVAAKHGVVGVTRAMAIELAPHRVRVNAVLPGSVDSPMLDGLAQDLGVTPDDVRATFAPFHLVEEVIQPEDVARAVVWLAGEEARFVTGHLLAVDAGWLTK